MAKPPPALVLGPPPAKTKKAPFEWEAALSNLVGVPYSQNVKKFFDAWHSIDNSNATNNPFNITLDPLGTATGDLTGNTAHVKNFPTALDGLKATAKFLVDRTPSILQHLASGDYLSAANAVGSSGWAPNDPTYGRDLYNSFKAGTYVIGNNAPTDLSPADKAAFNTAQATANANAKSTDPAYLAATGNLAAAKGAAGATAKAGSPTYQDATGAAAIAAAEWKAGSPQYIAAEAQLSLERASAIGTAKKEAHLSDPWVTVKENAAGKIVGFGESTGFKAPDNVLMVGGLPATKSTMQGTWSASYESIFQAYTGRVATAAEQAEVLQNGWSTYTLMKKLSGFDPKTGKYVGSPTFKQSPAYQQDGARIEAYAKAQLGKAASPEFVAKAIINNWTDAAIDANLRLLPNYSKSPAFSAKQATIHSVYDSIYGVPDAHGQDWIKQAALNGWTQDQAAQTLRQDPAYKFSPEYESKAVNFLDAMGMFVGQRPILTQQVPPPAALGTGLRAPLNLAPAKVAKATVTPQPPHLPTLPVPA